MAHTGISRRPRRSQEWDPVVPWSRSRPRRATDSAPAYEALSYTWVSPETEYQKRKTDPGRARIRCRTAHRHLHITHSRRNGPCRKDPGGINQVMILSSSFVLPPHCSCFLACASRTAHSTHERCACDDHPFRHPVLTKRHGLSCSSTQPFAAGIHFPATSLSTQQSPLKQQQRPRRSARRRRPRPC